jgi:hypothetical protein
VRAIELLYELADDSCAGGVGEQRQLAKVLGGGVAIRCPLQRSADENDALLRRRERDQVPGDGPDSP